MFINEALAQTAEATEAALPEGSGMRLLFQFALIFAIFYFILIRPQTKRMKEHKKEINAITKGDKIVCSGIVGKVSKIVSDTEIEVEVADGVKVIMIRDLVSAVIEKAGGKPHGNVGDAPIKKAKNKAEQLKKALDADDNNKEK